MEAETIESAETIPASRKLGYDEAAALFREAGRVVICKGTRVDEYRPGGKADPEAITKMLGSTGNLRAPSLRVGKTVLVGFNEEIYREVLT